MDPQTLKIKGGTRHTAVLLLFSVTGAENFRLHAKLPDLIPPRPREDRQTSPPWVFR